MSVIIEINDKIHARLYNEDRSQVAVQNFIVTEIEGSIYRGGVIDCDTNAGWELELIRKSFSNLNLPTEISEITAYNHKDVPVLLTGKGSTWRDGNGSLYNTDNIFRWELGHIEIPSERIRPAKRIVELE